MSLPDNIYQDVKRHYPRFRGLLGSILLLWLCVIIPSDSLLSKLFLNFDDRALVYLFLSLFVVIPWVHTRYIFPRSKKNKIGLLVAIETESDKQKVRIKNDLVKRLNELVGASDFSSEFSIVVLNNHQSITIRRRLHQFAELQKIERSGKKFSKRDLRKLKRWLRVRNWLRCHFIIFGSIKERKNSRGLNAYYFEIDGCVNHLPIPAGIQQEVEGDLTEFWLKQISFDESAEFYGFIVTAELVYLVAKYVIGVGFLVSGKVAVALRIHEDLEKELVALRGDHPKLEKIRLKLSGVIATECDTLARLYYTRGDVSIARAYIEKGLQHKTSQYNLLKLRAYIEFKEDHDAVRALSTVKLAGIGRPHADWLYDQAFLLMYLEKFEEALDVYKKIVGTVFPNEKILLTEILGFNKRILISEPSKIQCLFIIGLLKYKKEKNIREAAAYFDEFIIAAEGVQKYQSLVKRARSYGVELEKGARLG